MNETRIEPLDLLHAEHRAEALLSALAANDEFRRCLVGMPQAMAAAYAVRWQTDRSEFDCVRKGLRAFRGKLIRLAASDELPELPLTPESLPSLVEMFQQVILHQAQSDTTIQLRQVVNGSANDANGLVALPAEKDSAALETLKGVLLDSVLPKLNKEDRPLFSRRMDGMSLAALAEATQQTEKSLRRQFRAILDKLRADYLEAEQDPATNHPLATMHVTCEEAAYILNVSRRFLVAELEQGNIPSLDGKHERRVLLKQLVDYKRIQDKLSLQVLEELSALDQELGFY